MHDKLENRGLTVITVNTDPPTSSSKDAAMNFLKREGADVVNLMIADAPDRSTWLKNKHIDAFPHTEVFDRKGIKRKTIVGLNEKELDSIVKELLDS